ncbi:MAG: hypothetical protein ACXAC7_22800 [Candidatus Hodarchaeales archaeon]
MKSSLQISCENIKEKINEKENIYCCILELDFSDDEKIIFKSKSPNKLFKKVREGIISRFGDMGV